MVPTAVFLDRRLTLEQLRVLGAICSFRGSADEFTVWPKREEIARRCGMALCKVSEATTALEAFGWIRKSGKGGFSKATSYTITVPQSVTVTEQVTVPQSVRGVVTDSVTGMGVTDSVTGKEEKTNMEEIGEKARPMTTVTDPNQLPVLEIGFVNGHEEPELFTQDLPNVGSMFSNDQLTFKIRHEYGGVVLVDGEKGVTKAVVAG